MSAPIFALFLLVNLLVAFVALGHSVLQFERSRFRYRLWQLRDELVDSDLARLAAARPAITRRVETCEILIAGTNILTPLQLFTFQRRLEEPAQNVPMVAPGNLEAEVLVRRADRTIRDALSRLLLLGSPSGWVRALLFAPLFPAYLVRNNARKRRAATIRRIHHSAHAQATSTLMDPRMPAPTPSPYVEWQDEVVDIAPVLVAAHVPTAQLVEA